MQLMTQMQQAFVSSLKENEQTEAMARIIKNDVFYADVIPVDGRFLINFTF